MVKQEVSQDTIKLLKECDAGCKMAIDSMEQISKYVTDDQMKSIIKKYNDGHIKMEEDIHRLLNSYGEEDKEPNPIAKASSWIQSEVKMMINGDSKQAAYLLTDGCNMGVTSLNKYKNQYKAADQKSVEICERLCDMETSMTKDLQPYL
ncbi:MAG: hypothetical protein IJ958_05280 [Agathobacter sp.]|nr:hypothetical protein [Agathobacter sp.]